MPNPISGLLHSRKFCLLILDTLVSLALYFVGKYAPAGVFEDVKFVIAALQPVFVAVIIMIAYEDKAAMEAESRDYQTRLYESAPKPEPPEDDDEVKALLTEVYERGESGL